MYLDVISAAATSMLCLIVSVLRNLFLFYFFVYSVLRVRLYINKK